MIKWAKIAIVLFFLAICATPVVNRSLLLHREEVRPSELYRVIYSQLDAFRASDYSKAYSQASYGIQQKFNPDQFIEMIRHQYSGITQAERVEFGLVKCRDQHALIQVFFIDREGGVLPCIYSLIYEGENWKIDGARMLPRWPVGSRLGGIQA